MIIFLLGIMNLAQIDLVDIEKVNPSIILDIRYATSNNFTGRPVYSLSKCYLRKKVAEKLNIIQKEIEKLGLGLKIFDGYRPHSIQYKFWELVPDPLYVGDPAKGSSHNRGSAVDLTLVDSNGVELAMPTEFDDFTERAHRDYCDLSEEVLQNRQLLEDIMTKHGFVGLCTEWWHFSDSESENYELLDYSFEELSDI